MRFPQLIALLGLLGFAASNDAWEPRLERNDERPALNAMQGKMAPALSVTNWINSKPLTLADLKGKVVVVEFWGTWCTTCLSLVPHHNELAKKYASKGLVFIGVCDRKGSEKMAQIAKERAIEYPIAVDVNDMTADAYKCDSTPDFYLIDREGRLRWADIETDDVDKAIDVLVSQR